MELRKGFVPKNGGGICAAMGEGVKEYLFAAGLNLRSLYCMQVYPCKKA